MTRQEIIDSLVASGHGENILRCPNGVIKVGAFTDWLRPIMISGSSEKTLECDSGSFLELIRMGLEKQHGYRLKSDEPSVLITPYGKARLHWSAENEGIRIIDVKAFSCGHLIAQSQGVSDTIMEIVI